MDKKARPKLKVKRQQVRRRRHQSAWITLENGTANCKCQVEDVSRNGAKITLDRAVEVGKLFDMLSAKAGAWSIRNGQLVFAEQATLSSFNGHIGEIQKMAARQEALQKQATDSTRAKLENMK